MKLSSVSTLGGILHPFPTTTTISASTTLNTNALIGSTLLKANGCFDAKDTNETAGIPAHHCPTPSICS